MEALPRQQDNEYGGSRLVVSWSCSLRSIIRLPASKIYPLYSLYLLYYIIHRCRQYPPKPRRKMQPIKTSIQSTYLSFLYSSTPSPPSVPIYTFCTLSTHLYPLYPSIPSLLSVPSPLLYPSISKSMLEITFALMRETRYSQKYFRSAPYPHTHTTVWFCKDTNIRNLTLPLLSTFVPFCPLFICKKLSYNRCFF